MYDERIYGVHDILCAELEAWFNDLQSNSINLYFLHNTPINNIKLDKVDFKFFKQVSNKNESNFYNIDFDSYPTNIKLIKNLQLKDF
jgi:hypothetical protein